MKHQTWDAAHPFVYLDHAATTPVDGAVLEAMLPYFTELYGNPASVYTFAGKAREAVEHARAQAAEMIHARPREIYFTSGGSESDNWALKAAMQAARERGRHLITTQIEHPAVLRTCAYLEQQGCEVTYVGVDEQGVVRLDELKAAIRPDTVLISVMAANNEIGTIQPLAEIGRLAKARQILFHTDAVQAYGHIPLDVEHMGIDLLSASGHKLNGPKGTGILYIRSGVKLPAWIHGGSQERNRRAGTSNVSGVVGLGAAAQLASEQLEQRMAYETKLRDDLIARILTEIPDARLNGDPVRRLPNNVHVCFDGLRGESLLILLDQKGICASAGSACSSGSLEPSYVLRATGVSPERAAGALRLTLSHQTTREELDYTVETLKTAVRRLRAVAASENGNP